MAELVENVPGAAATVMDGGSAHPRVSWGAVFAGAVAAIGLWMLLLAFGLAVGASTLDVQDAGSAKATGIFTGIWGGLAPLIALFIGGIVAGRGAGVAKRGDGALHGFVTWGLATIAGAWLVTSLLGAIAGGVATVGRGAAQAAGAAGANASKIGQAMRSAGIDSEDLVRPINQRLRAEGRPTVSADQLEAAAQDALQRSVREGRVDRTMVARSLSENTSLSRSDVDSLADQVTAQLDRGRTQLASGVQTAANAAGKALWGAFVALLLGLIAAIVGGLLGVPGKKKQRRQREAMAAQVPVTRAPTVPPREVYP